MTKFALVVNDRIDTISFEPQEAPWIEVDDDVFAGFNLLDDEWVPPDPEGSDIVVVFPVDLWSRLSDDEAELVEAAMAEQPVRIQNIFRSAASYRSDHELWPLLTTVAADLFGAVRAGEILAAS
jgi:hypothetical protein